MEKEPFILKDSLLFIDSWNKINPSIIAGMSTRQGGFSQAPFETMNLGFHVNDRYEDVLRNRHELAKNLQIPLQTWVCGEQVHGAKVVKVTKDDQGKGAERLETAIKGVDGLYTKERNTMLLAMYADCVPIYFFAPKYNIVGIAHAGWRGTVNNIAGEMIAAWTKEENVPIEEIFVAIGPSIAACCYNVDDVVKKQVENVVDSDQVELALTTESAGQYRLNLKQVNYLLLTKAGILAKNIEISKYCTSCQDDLFFSHRRDHGHTGRMGSFIGIKDENNGGPSLGC